ncbi:transposase [Xanthomonas translucens pv. undulosa]|uniref:REP-associated tyrosine transposase n=1 Tax=Xanthomonas campestris pv. translucens TaxID=343 RepID=UPI001E5042D4|nr:transposase [Xanthomonas translucens]WLA04712.1 transposase [Xanthomonas translucens]
MPQLAHFPGHAALRRGRHDEAGRTYLLTVVTFQRAALFSDWRCARAAAACLSAPASWPQVQLLCWVLMPDHWHGLIELGPRATLSDAMQHAKGRCAHAVNRARGRGGRVWSPGFHDRALRREDDMLTAARYIVANPLRAGLVRRLGDYPYWDAIWLSAHGESKSGRG